jgi:hypothetical protein
MYALTNMMRENPAAGPAAGPETTATATLPGRGAPTSGALS